MNAPDRLTRVAALTGGAALAAGIVLFGGIQPEVAGALAAVLGASAALVLVRARPTGSRTWAFAGLAFPAFVALQLVPLPRALVALVSPTRAAWADAFWPGPLTDCDGGVLVSATPPSWLPLSIDTTATAEFLFQVVTALAVFFAARALLAGRRTARRGLLAALAGLTVAEAAYGLWQWSIQSRFVLWVPKTGDFDRGGGTLINANHFALLINVGLGATLALLLERLQVRHHHGDAGRETAIRTTLALALALQFAAVLASQSRAGLLGALVVLASAAPALWRAPRVLRAAGLAMLALVLVPTLLVAGPRLVERFARAGFEWSGAGARGDVARHAWDLVAAFPLFGTGAGTFEFAFARYRTPGIPGFYDYAHNDYLQLLTETGLPGLVLALLPVGLYAAAVLRSRRRASRFADHGPPPPWPVYGALAAVALHELFDFGLQMPALAYLVALVAGAFAPPLFPAQADEARAAAARGPLRALAAAALLLALPALSFSVARWPVAGGMLPLPALPDVMQLRATRAFEAWRLPRLAGAPDDGPGVPAPLCEAVALQARAQRLRPASSRYATNHARYLVAAAELGSIADEHRERWQEEAARLADKSRAIDPAEPWNRERLLELSLALHALDRAVADAEMVTAMSPDLAPRVVRQLFEVGLPAASVASVIARTPAAQRAFLRQMTDAGDDALAAQLVPRDVAPDEALCASGDLVARVLRRGHGAPGEPFLLACLELPAVRARPNLPDSLRIWLASDRLERNDDAGAAAAIADIADARKAAQVRIALAERAKDWSAAARYARLILSQPPGTPEGEAWLRYRLGRALAMNGQLAEALPELERAAALNPALADAERAIAHLRHGRNPFR